MEKHHFPGVAEEDSDPTPEAILVELDPYIVTLVGRLARSLPSLVRTGTDDLDEIAQRVRIKYWRALECRPIEHHKAYIRSIVMHEIAEMARKRKPTLPLLYNEDGELYMGDVEIAICEEMANPEAIYLEGESFLARLERCMAFMSALPARQQRVLACRVFEAIGELQEVIEAFERHDIGEEMQRWPASEADKKLLKASHSAARKKAERDLLLEERIAHALNRFERPRRATRIPASEKALARR